MLGRVFDYIHFLFKDNTFNCALYLNLLFYCFFLYKKNALFNNVYSV